MHLHVDSGNYLAYLVVILLRVLMINNYEECVLYAIETFLYRDIEE